MSTSFTLRPHQAEALASVRAAAGRGVGRQLIVHPTGTGKTVTFARLCAERVKERGGRILILAHRKELLHQAAAHLERELPEARVGTVKAEQDEIDADVVIASVQTLSRPKRLARLGKDFHTVICDEAHHAAAETYLQVFRHLGIPTVERADGAAGFDHPLLLGVTATGARHDRKPLDVVFDEIVHTLTILDAVRRKLLTPPRAIQVGLELGLDDVPISSLTKDFREGALGEALLYANAPDELVLAYQEHAAGRKRTLVFLPSVAAVHRVTDAFHAAGIRADAVDGSTPSGERQAVLERLRTGETPVVCNCEILTEGFDEPAVDCIVMARPTKSHPLYVQIIGRGLRLSDGKEDCLVLDVVDVTTRHELKTLATLLGWEGARVLDDETLLEADEREEREADARERLDIERYRKRQIARIVDLFGGGSLAWVEVEKARVYVLPGGNGEDGSKRLVLVGSPDGEVWTVLVASAPDPWSWGRRATYQTIADNERLEMAQAIAAQQVELLGAGGLTNPRAKWRSAPASEPFRRFARGLGVAGVLFDTQGQLSDAVLRAQALKFLAGQSRREKSA